MAGSVDLVSGWSSVWSSVTSAVGSKLTNLMTAVGVIIVVFALGKWLWERRRGGGGSHSGLIYSMAVGGLLAAPEVIIPVLLTIIDYVINAVVGVFSK